MDSSEEQLPALLVTDLKRNFERLVLAYQDRLYAFVLSRVHNALAAEEKMALERAIHVWDTLSGRQLFIFRGHKANIVPNSITWSPLSGENGIAPSSQCLSVTFCWFIRHTV